MLHSVICTYTLSKIKSSEIMSDGEFLPLSLLSLHVQILKESTTDRPNQSKIVKSKFIKPLEMRCKSVFGECCERA